MRAWAPSSREAQLRQVQPDLRGEVELAVGGAPRTPGAVPAVDQEDTQAGAQLQGGEQARRSGPDDDDVEVLLGVGHSLGGGFPRARVWKPEPENISSQ